MEIGVRSGIFAVILCIIGVALAGSTLTENIWKTSPLKEATAILASALQYVGQKVPMLNYWNDGNVNPPWVALQAALGAVVTYTLYQLLFVHMNRVRLLGEVGYVQEQGATMEETVKMVVQRRRKVGTMPPVYPNGWFSVIESRDLLAGQVKSVNCLGKNLAVFRGEDGKAHAVDAYCPHMGANLSVGGLVKGNCLECPFHGWQFRGADGKCIHIPYVERNRIPDVARVTAYTVLECNGFIYMWHHAEGDEPNWKPPEMKEITNGEWTYRGRTEHIVNAHIEEIPENGADIAHLPQVHGPSMTSGVDLRYIYNTLHSFLKHKWLANWEQDETEKHVGTLTIVHSLRIFGFRVGILDLKVEARQIGPGFVYMTFNSIFGKGAFIHSLTPIEPLTQRMIHHVYFQRFTPTIIAKFFMLAEALQVERDIMIWNNKRYEGKPILVKSNEDSLVVRHRRWYSQFYSENSPRISNAANNSMDW